MIPAPVHVEPGSAGDSMGVEGRHRDNMQKIFGYLNHVNKVTNDHADFMDEEEFGHRSMKRQVRKQAWDIAKMKAIIERSQEDMKAELLHNDFQLKEALAISMKAVWAFLEQNDNGTMKLFHDADAAVAKSATTM